MTFTIVSFYVTTPFYHRVTIQRPYGKKYKTIAAMKEWIRKAYPTAIKIEFE